MKLWGPWPWLPHKLSAATQRTSRIPARNQVLKFVKFISLHPEYTSSHSTSAAFNFRVPHWPKETWLERLSSNYLFLTQSHTERADTKHFISFHVWNVLHTRNNNNLKNMDTKEYFSICIRITLLIPSHLSNIKEDQPKRPIETKLHSEKGHRITELCPTVPYSI